MLEKHHILFIKPINGALGKGIYRLKKTSQGISSQYSTISGQMHRHFNKLSELYTWLNKRLTKQNFVLQEGISILSYRGRAIDFRALMQKNSNGVWSATSTVARIGPVNRFVSNVARGGGMSAVLPILRRCRVSQPSLKRSSLLATAKKICEEIDKSLAGDFGELGVDLAMNKAGRIYLLEVNSKPSKNDKSIGSLSQNKGRPSAHRLLDYAGYLIDEKKGKKEL
jgi:glutathione synthase/RimK-type ligase-like ATP-grasp enzyme